MYSGMFVSQTLCMFSLHYFIHRSLNQCNIKVDRMIIHPESANTCICCT